ncbi:MAG: hypothetical protein Q8O88_00970 [bacterium]|nr:hypothetical protein [bacterium]
MKKGICIDIDGVLAEWHAHFLDYVELKTGVRCPIKDFKGWEAGILSESDTKKLHDQYLEEGFYQTVPVMDGAVPGLKYLRALRDIVICTARSPTNTQMMADTKFWLRLHHLHNYELVFERNKVQMCQSRGIDELVEDNIGTLKKAADNNMRPYGMLRPYNTDEIRADNKIFPIQSLAELLFYFLK